MKTSDFVCFLVSLAFAAVAAGAFDEKSLFLALGCAVLSLAFGLASSIGRVVIGLAIVGGVLYLAYLVLVRFGGF